MIQTPSSPESQESPEPPERDADRPETAAEQQRGVLQQRRHIEALDGEDPLRGGVAD